MAELSKRVPHLVCRGGRFRFRMRVPRALVPVFGAEVAKALGDVSPSGAADEARRLTAEWTSRFLAELQARGLASIGTQHRARALSASRSPTRDEVVNIARAAARELLVQDEEVRIEGTRTEVGDWWLGELSELDTAVVAALAEGDAKGLWHRFITDLSRHGLSMPEDATERRRMLRAWASEQARALQAIKARHRGEPVDTPPPVSLVLGAAAPTAKKMRDALDAWRTTARRPDKTVDVFERHVGTFERIMEDPPLSALRRADAVRFRDALQAWAVTEKRTAATADNVLTSIKALVNVARDREWLEGNPFERLSVSQGGKESAGREPWTRDEVVRLFDAPLYTAYELPGGSAMGRKGGADAAYWVPLLAAYTGARPGELCQLWTDDVSEGEGGLVVELRTDDERGQRLKTEKDARSGKVGSWRALPVHSELIRLGFRDYWRATADAGRAPGPLFPSIPREGKNGAAGQFGQWFGEFKRKQGFASATKTLHSFRHTVETELGFAGVSGTLVDAITGHAGQGIGRKVYAATIRREAERLRPTVELLGYPGLELAKVYSAG